MELGIQGKRALVTGSSAGIGEAIAKSLAREGVKVVIQGRNEKELARVAKEIEQSGGSVTVTKGDLANQSDAERVAEQALSAFGGIDILVNNAGAYDQRDWWETPPEDWLSMYNNNVVSMVRIIKGVVPQMKSRGWGRVIQIASVAGVQPVASMPHYAATKSANIVMTVSLAKEMGDSGVTVNTVSPGPILTPGVETLFRAAAKENGWGDDWDGIEKRVVGQFGIPLGRFGKPDEIASAVLFLASERAAFIQGANIRVDGGFCVAVN